MATNMFQKVAQFYAGAFSIIAIFSLLLAFKISFIFLLISIFSTLLVVFYSFIYKQKSEFKTVG